MSKIYNQLKRAFVKAGLPEKATKMVKRCRIPIDDPVEILVNMPVDAAPYADILLKYAQRLTDPKEIQFVARTMMQKQGFRHAVPWLLSLFENYPGNGLNKSDLWAIGYAIYTIDNEDQYSDVIKLCKKKKYGRGRQMLMGTLARSKRKAAYDLLLKLLHDPWLRGHAIEAVGRFGNPDAIPLLERLEVKKGLYEYKAKQTALRRLRRKL